MSRLLLTIDQTPCRASYGFQTPEGFSRDLAESGRKAVQENIARFVADGNRMARIGSGENAVAEIAAEAYLAEPPAEITITSVARPVIRVTEVSGGAVDIFI